MSFASKIRAANSALIADQNLDAVGEFFTSDYVVHLTDEDMAGGHGAIRRVLGTLLGAFPDLQVEVEILVEAEDRVAWQRTLRGAQEGDFSGIPASGRQVEWRDMLVTRFRDGLIAEEWVVTDLAERLLRPHGRHGPGDWFSRRPASTLDLPARPPWHSLGFEEKGTAPCPPYSGSIGTGSARVSPFA